MQKTLLGIMLTSTLTIFYGKFVEVGVNSKGKTIPKSTRKPFPNKQKNTICYDGEEDTLIQLINSQNLTVFKGA